MIYKVIMPVLRCLFSKLFVDALLVKYRLKVSRSPLLPGEEGANCSLIPRYCID